jgi:hypothetical protein
MVHRCSVPLTTVDDRRANGSFLTTVQWLEYGRVEGEWCWAGRGPGLPLGGLTARDHLPRGGA